MQRFRLTLVAVVLALALLCAALPVVAQESHGGALVTVRVAPSSGLGVLGTLDALWTRAWVGFWTELARLAPSAAPAGSRGAAVSGLTTSATSTASTCDLDCGDRTGVVDPDG